MIKRYLLILTASLFLMILSSSVLAMEDFVVKGIDIKGLQHLSYPTVISYVPLKIGDTFTEKKGVEVVKRLYGTKFFNNIQLSKSNDTLVITVQERPTIKTIQFQGNKAVSDKQLKEVLEKTDIQEGQFYNSSQLKAIQEGLKLQYRQLGYPNATVTTIAQPESNNQVSLVIKVVEGSLAKVKQINFIGNKAFSTHRLKSNLSMTPTNLLSLITHNDRYSEEGLNKDTQELENFYLNRGYLKFKILSKTVSPTSNGKGIAITFKISEGNLYRISGFAIKGNLLGKKEELKKLITFQVGDPFSREKVIEINKKIKTQLSDYSYAMPNIQTIPKVDDKAYTVFLTWQIDPGSRIYVRHIDFEGNTHTEDSVLRFQLRQLEGGLYSSSAVEESKRRIANLPYFSGVEVSNKPVEGKPNQVDLTYKMKEVNAGKASIQGGFSDTDGLVYGASITDPNLIGTGKYAGIGFENSQYMKNYFFTYNNPFYTTNGISRGFSIYYQDVTADQVNITSYTTSGFGASLSYGIPLSDYNTLALRFAYDNIKVTTSENTDQSILDFIDRYGRYYNQFTFSPSWIFNSYDRAIFPTSGTKQIVGTEIGAPVISSSLSYYKLNYDLSHYHPLDSEHNWVLNLRTTLGYGNGYGNVYTLPFFKHYYAGGIETMPGFRANTLGPKDAYGNGLGGNVLMLGGVNLIFPNYISKTLRTAITFNAGNVYQDQVKLNDFRYSAGLSIAWFSPLGAIIQVSFAEPLNAKMGDKKQFFAFSFGASI